MSTAEIVIKSPHVAPERRLLDGSVISIGRSNDCSFPIPDRFLSRNHAELRLEKGGWILRDFDSVNGTWLNGERIKGAARLSSGDRIRMGETKISFHVESVTDRITMVQDAPMTPSISIAVSDVQDTPRSADALTSRKSVERLVTLNTLAAEMLAEHDEEELLGFILKSVLRHSEASRAAIAFLDEEEGVARSIVERRDRDDQQELRISSTLLAEVVERRTAVAYVDVASEEKLVTAPSIADQGVRSVLCAPVIVEDEVIAVLYLDYLLTQREISEDDVRLIAQIAGLAALKIETAALRREALQMRLLDEELRTAFSVQQSLLPDSFPERSDYSFFGMQRPARTVGGDYYDLLEIEDGTIYFMIADVSGKGITAALLVAGLQATFRILARDNTAPDQLLTRMNASLIESTPVSTFVTLIVGRLKPSTGVISFSNGGHLLPLLISNEIREIGETDIIVGSFANARYRLQSVELGRGDSLLLFTDGLTELEGAELEIPERLISRLQLGRGCDASTLGSALERMVNAEVPAGQLTDDVTFLIVSRRNT